MLSDQVSQTISLAPNAQTATVKVAQAASHKVTPLEDTAVSKRRLKLKELIDQITRMSASHCQTWKLQRVSPVLEY